MGTAMFKVKLNLAKRYQAEVAAKHIRFNPQQQAILATLEQSYVRSRARFLWSSADNSVYIHGSVGSGKTYLMDLFYQALPQGKKWRIHFHDLMEYINQALRYYQGQANPMQTVVSDLANSYQVICIDELLVEDVVQAMIFVELLPPLMEQGVMLVFTSNTRPMDLYRNGLQRDRFLTVIHLLENKAKILALSAAEDYRRQRFPRPEQTYFINQDEQFKSIFMQYLSDLREAPAACTKLQVQGRELECKVKSQSMIWFGFEQIANIPRCQRDYMELVQRYKIFFVSDLPGFDASNSAALILWMYFIDVLYNAKVKLVLASKLKLEALYPEGPMLTAFQRTLSRMREMQSQWYWEL